MNDAALQSLVQSLIVGVISGVASSATFFVIIAVLLRPRFKISHYISSTTDSDGITVLRFKIVNLSFFQVNDLEISLDKVKSRAAPAFDKRGGLLLRRDKIELSRSFLAYVHRYWPFEQEAKYAIQIRTKDISFIDSWHEHDGDYLVLSVSGKHGLSGLNGSESQNFYSRNVIKPGKFFTGRNLQIYN